MANLLITGAGPNGITGRLLKEKLSSEFNIYSPGSKDLDLCDKIRVEEYVKKIRIDYIIHCATFRDLSTPGRNLLDSNLRMFYNLASCSNIVDKVITLGSGAEYDKRNPIVNCTESNIGKSIPIDGYGFSKYIINEYVRKSENIYNLRLFGTINEYERFTKNIISNFCAKTALDIPLTIRQDCRFSFVDIVDLSNIILWFIGTNSQNKDYNVCLSKSYLLSELAKIILDLSDKKLSIDIFKGGLNNEYTGNSTLLSTEMGDLFIDRPIENSLSRVYTYFESIKENLDIELVRSSI